MMTKRQLNENMKWYLFLIIPIFGTLVFNFYPLLSTLVNSFQNSQDKFIGAVNYQILFKDSVFRQSFWNTIYMAILGVGFYVPIAFIIATMLNNISVGKNAYKVVFLLPMVMSMVTAATLFQYILYPSEQGIVNYLLSPFMSEPAKWFNDPRMARESVIIMAVWKGMGYNIILFFAGLQAIPVELYEAASIDGAGEFKKWVHITIPGMKNSFVFVFITSMIAALKRFTEVYAISGETGAPGGMLNTLMLYIYKNSFSTLNYKDEGLATSASIILFLIILIATMINMGIGNRGNGTKVRKGGKR